MILADYILSKINTPFEYGVNDCVLFTIGWAEIAHGKKYLPSKIWANEKEALKLIKKNGGIEKAFDENFNRIEPNYAKDGDITIVDGIAYIFSGSGLVSVGKNGTKIISRSESKIAWDICNG